jgi:hypothetical protein
LKQEYIELTDPLLLVMLVYHLLLRIVLLLLQRWLLLLLRLLLCVHSVPINVLCIMILQYL